MMLIGLFIILAVVLIAPFSVKIIEEELEIFLFVIGCIAVTITSQWGLSLLKEALRAPLAIASAVFVFGLLFKTLQKTIAHTIKGIAGAIGVKLFTFLLIVLLGFLSGIITAIIAALVLVEITICLALKENTKSPW